MVFIAHSMPSNAPTPCYSTPAPSLSQVPNSSAHFLENLAQFMHTVDALLLRSLSAWNPHEDANGVPARPKRSPPSERHAAHGPDAPLELAAAARGHLLHSFLSMLHGLSASGGLQLPDSTFGPPSMLRPKAPAAALHRLCSDVANFRLFVQWAVSALLLGWSGGALSLDAPPLARPAELLLSLLSPLNSKHAAGLGTQQVLAVLGSIRLAAATHALPLLQRLLFTPAPSGDVWLDLLPPPRAPFHSEDDSVRSIEMQRWFSSFQQLEVVQLALDDLHGQQVAAASARDEALKPVVQSTLLRQQRVSSGGWAALSSPRGSDASSKQSVVQLPPAPPPPPPQSLARQNECDEQAARRWRKLLFMLEHEADFRAYELIALL